MGGKIWQSVENKEQRRFSSPRQAVLTQYNLRCSKLLSVFLFQRWKRDISATQTDLKPGILLSQLRKCSDYSPVSLGSSRKGDISRRVASLVKNKTKPTNQSNKQTCALGKKNLCSDIDISHFFELPVFSPLFSLKIYMPKQHILRGILMNYLVSYFVLDFSFLTFYSFSVNWKGMRIPERHNTRWHRNIFVL